jgi:hypothetical protein
MTVDLPEAPHVEEEDGIGRIHAHLLHKLSKDRSAIGHITGAQAIWSALETGMPR